MCSCNCKDDKFHNVFLNMILKYKVMCYPKKLCSRKTDMFSTYMLCDNYATEHNKGPMKDTNRY